MTGRRGQETAAGAAALLTLLAVVVGLPVLLFVLGGSPLPSHLPDLSRIGHDLMHRDSASVVLAAVRDVSWIAWALFTIAVLTEVQAVLRRRTPPRLWLGGLQDTAGRLVALAALTFTSAPVGTLLVSPQPTSAVMTVVPQAEVTPLVSAQAPPAGAQAPPAGAQAPPTGVQAPPAGAQEQPQADAALSPAGATEHAAPAGAQADAYPAHAADRQEDAVAARPGAQGMSMGFYKLVTVRPGDCLWTIAQHYLGSGDRYTEIVALNLGHDMGGGHVFTDPSVIWPGWVLHLPARAGGGHGHHRQGPGGHLDGGTHGGHPTRHAPFRHPHRSAAPTGNGHSPSGTVPSPSPAPASTRPAGGQAGGSSPIVQTGSDTPVRGDESRLPLIAAFGTGVLAGGAVVSLSRLRHRQRQTRRRGRRIPLPASAPVAEAEQRLNLTAARQPVASLRGVLHDLGAALIATGQQIPQVTGLRLTPDVLDVLLASPAIEPPPEPFTVPGGRQGMTWRLSLDDGLPGYPDEAGDLLPGLLTVGISEGGYLLLDLEHLQVTQVGGPDEMTTAVLRSAAAELATGQLAGWYDLILVGFPELSVLGGRGTCCDDLDAGLDLLAAKAVALRRRLGDAPLADVRYHRLAEPGDEDWALTLLVSAVPPTSGQLAMLSDLAAEPGGIAALVPAGPEAGAGHREPVSIDLSSGPGTSDSIVAQIGPLQLEARPQVLDDADYEALTSLFSTASEDYDVAPADPPYDSWTWPPDVINGGGPAGGGPADDELEPGAGPAGHTTSYTTPYSAAHVAEAAEDRGLAGDAGASAGAADPADAAEVPAEVGSAHWAAPPGWAADQDWLTEPGWADAGWASDGTVATEPPPGPGNGAAEVPAADPDWAGNTAVVLEPPPLTEPAPLTEPPPREPEPGPAAAEPVPGQAGAANGHSPGSHPPGLRIGVLGAFTINGQPGALLPAQSQLVLALALNSPSGLSNQQLCYLLGADPDRPKPSDSLRQLIVRTRRQLGRAPDRREWIEHLGGGQYALHPDARFDWHEFNDLTTEGMRARDAQRLRTALGLIRGRPFTGCYYWWLDLATTEAVRAQIVDAADVLAALELAAGDPAAAARAARTGLAGDAGAEQLWRALMRAEHAAGNLSGVREAWNRCLDAIGEIAPDGEPHPGTAALYRDLLGAAAPAAWAGR